MLSIESSSILYTSPPKKETGTVRYRPSFRVSVATIKVVGYAPRGVIDDESGFLVLVDNKAKVYSFNLDVVTPESLRELEAIFHFNISTDTPDYSYGDYTRGLSVVVSPPSLAGKRLFKGWSWFTPRGILKNVGYVFATDNLLWERVTDEVEGYVLQIG